MIKILVLIIALIFSYKIFTSKEGYKKILWVITGFMLLHGNIIVIEHPIMPISRWLIVSLLISELYSFTKFKYEFSNFPLKRTLIILIIGSFCIGILDNRLNLFLKISTPLTELIDGYFIIFLGYFLIGNKNDIYKIT